MNTASAYVEPDYNNIIKHENFDEDVMKPMLTDPRFNKQDKARLSNYNKHRRSGSLIHVNYKFGSGCEEDKLGRLYPEDNIGLQSFRFDMRNPLADKWYWDTDIENAHYTIASKWCERLQLKHDFIDEYINNRAYWLTKGSSRKKIKTEFLKTLYGGNIQLYSNSYLDEEGSIDEELQIFLNKLSNEIKNLMTVVWDNYPQHHKLKTGTDPTTGKKIAIDKKSNPKASLMSLLFQTEERKMLMVWDWFLAQNDRYLATYIHDGGYVLKLEGESEFPPELLIEGAKVIKQITGYNVKLTCKPMEYDWKPYKPQESQYDVMKNEFEKHTFIVGSDIYHIQPDGRTEFLKPSQASVKFGNKFITIWDEEQQKSVRKKFFNMWLEDANRLSYERIDFYPNKEACPSYVYNTFKGFNADKYKPEVPLTVEERNELVEPIITHFNYITGGYAANMIKWLANIVQFPHKKSEVSPVIRDMGGLLTEGGGVGKNLIFEWFGFEILGNEYFVVVGDNRELFSSFNGIFENTLLVFVEEANGKDNHIYRDLLKSKITAKQSIVNKKGINQFKMNDYARYLITTNGPNPVSPGRRHEIYDSDTTMRNNVKYFTTLANHLKQDKVKWAFYDYLMTCDTYDNPIMFMNSIPITKAFIDVKYRNAPLHLKWITDMTLKGQLSTEGVAVGDLYRTYCKWIETNREKSSCNIPSLNMFGRLLNDVNMNSIDEGYDFNVELGVKKRKPGVGTMIMVWDIDAIVKGLKSINLISNEFEYKDENECTITYN